MHHRRVRTSLHGPSPLRVLAISFSALAIDFLLPPSSLAALALLALLPWGRRARRWGRLLAVALLVPLVLMSLPIVAMPLLASLHAPEDPPGEPPQAIVILSADVEWTGTPGETDLGALTLERERAGAALHRRTGLPILVTGGIVTAPPPVAVMMARSMAEDFAAPVRWVEARSATTWENAQFSAPMLRAAGIGRVYLVTHDWHMRRALLSFRRAGIEAVPAVVRLDPWPKWSWQELMPRVSAWVRSYRAVHEWVGLLAYRMRA